MQCIQNEIIVNEIFCYIIMLGCTGITVYRIIIIISGVDTFTFFKILNNKLYIFKDLLSIVR